MHLAGGKRVTATEFKVSLFAQRHLKLASYISVWETNQKGLVFKYSATVNESAPIVKI